MILVFRYFTEVGIAMLSFCPPSPMPPASLEITSLGKAINPVRVCCYGLDEIINPAAASSGWCGMVPTSGPRHH